MILGLYCSFVVNLDYSAVGIMSGLTAGTVMLVLVLKGALTVWRAFLLGLLVMVSTWVRLESIEAVAAFSIPLVAIVLASRFRDRAFYKDMKYLPFFAALIPLAISYSVDHIHKARFSSPEYVAYSQWNDLRGEFNSNPISGATRSNQKVMAATGWSQADYQSLMKWFFTDESLYNTRSMQAFFNTAKSPGFGDHGPGYFSWRFSHLLLVYWFYWLMMSGIFLLIITAESNGL